MPLACQLKESPLRTGFKFLSRWAQHGYDVDMPTINQVGNALVNWMNVNRSSTASFLSLARRGYADIRRAMPLRQLKEFPPRTALSKKLLSLARRGYADIR
jgi:hypothetical protein